MFIEMSITLFITTFQERLTTFQQSYEQLQKRPQN